VGLRRHREPAVELRLRTGSPAPVLTHVARTGAVHCKKSPDLLAGGGHLRFVSGAAVQAQDPPRLIRSADNSPVSHISLGGCLKPQP
jgi:hypothetical protein